MVKTRSANSAAPGEVNGKFDDDFAPMAGASKTPGSSGVKKSESPVEGVKTEDGRLPPLKDGEEVAAVASKPGQPATFARDGTKVGAGPTELTRPEIPTPVAYLKKSRGRSNLAWLRSTFTKVALIYLAACYLIVCPTDPSRAPDTCKFLGEAHGTVARHAGPYVDAAKKQAAPYIKQAEPYYKPYYDQTKPYYAKASKAVAPQVSKARDVYFTHAHPRVLGALTGAHGASKPYYSAARDATYRHYGAARKATDPYLDSARKATDPYLSAAQPHVDRYTAMVQAFHKDTVAPNVRFATDAAQKGYDQAHSHFHAHVVPAYRRAGPVASQWWRESAQPGAQAAYAWSHKTYVGEVHPRIVRVADWVWEFLRARVLPAVKRWHSLYVKPQLDKITERVFEYRTQKVGREAKTEAKAHGSEKLHEAGFAENIDKFNSELAKENEAAKSSPGAVPTSLGKSKEEVAAKRKAIEAVRDSYEKDLADLIDEERKLFLRRLNELRADASKDIPNRFSPKVADLEREADTLIGRLEKYLERSAADDGSKTADEKIAEGKALGEKAIAKLQKSVDDAKDEVDAFGRVHLQREQEAMAVAHQPVQALAQEAQSKLGIELTWLDGVTYADWQRYHKLASNAEAFREELNGLQQGSRRTAAVARTSFYETLHALKGDMDRVMKSFNKRLRTVAQTGYQILKGSSPGVAANIADKIAAAASGVAGGAAVEDLAKSIADTFKSATGRVVGSGEPTPSNVAESASSIASDVAGSASSVASSLSSAAKGAVPAVDFGGASSIVSSVTDQAASVYADASSSVVSAVGGSSSPSNVASSASSLAAQATEAAAAALGGAGVAEAVKKAYGDASQIVIERAGGTASPTDLSQTVSSLYARATDAVPEVGIPGDLQASASSVAAAAASKLADASQAAVSAVGGEPSPTNLAQSASSILSKATAAIPEVNYEGARSVADAASAAFSDASQTVVAGLGGTPSPTDLGQTISSLVAQATGALPLAGADAAVSVLADASQSVFSAVGGTPSPTDLTQSAASVLARATDAVPEVEIPDLGGIGTHASVYSAAASSAVSDAASIVGSAAGSIPVPASAGKVVDDAQSAASSLYSRASEAVPDAASVQASAASAYSQVVSSASSLVSGASAAPSLDVPSQLSAAQDFASSLAGAVSQSVVSAAGGTPSPTDLSQTVASAAAQATDAAADVLAQAEEAAQEAARILRRRVDL